jgi:drug/metabolite transporter (DMT)-like permease
MRMAWRAFPAWFWRQAWLLLVLAILFWSGNAIVGRVGRDVVPPLTLAFLRWSGAFLLVLPFAWSHLRRDAPLLWQHWRIVLLLSTTGVGIFNSLLYISLHYTTATNSLLMQSTQSPMILLLGMLFFAQRPGPLRCLGALVSFAGVLVIVTQGSLDALLHLDIGTGELLVMLASACWAVYTLLLPRRPAVHPLSFTAASFAIGIAMTLPFAVVEYLHGARIILNGTALAGLFYVMVLPSLVAFLLFNRGVELIGSATAGQVLNLMPVGGALLAALILKEPLHTPHIIGMAMILAGIWLFARPAGAIRDAPG